VISSSLPHLTVANHSASATPPRASRSAGLCLAVSLGLLILVPIHKKSLQANLTYIVLATIVVLTIMTVATRRPQLPLPPTVLLIAYAFFAACSTVLDPHDDGIRRLLVHLMLGGSAFLMGVSCTGSERILVARSVIVLAAVESLYGVAEAAGLVGPIWGYEWVSSEGKIQINTPQESDVFVGAIRAQGSMYHPLVFAFLAVVGIGLLVGLKPFRSAYLRIGLVFLLYVGVFAAGSRSGIIVASFIILVSVLTAWTRILVIGSALAVSLVGPPILNNWILPVIDRFQNSTSMSNREASFKAFGPLLNQENISAVLFGNGFRAERRLITAGVIRGKHEFDPIDNQFVWTLACAGLIALILMIGVIAWTWMNGDRQYRWGLFAALVMFWSFEVLLMPTSLALTTAIMGMAVSCVNKPLTSATAVGNSGKRTVRSVEE
jgi:hypothetical protein